MTLKELSKIKRSLIAISLLIIISGSIFGLVQLWNMSAKQTGLGIFKGPAFSGLFGSSSDGTPLRDIHIMVWRNSSFSPFIATIVEGNTDRTGIFSFPEHEGYVDYASYSYNGVHYTDKLIVGAILRDNLP